MVDFDRLVVKFDKALSDEPDQVLRYHIGGQPLWIGRRVPEEADIPKCAHCGGPRQFEFQILPQILPTLDVSNLVCVCVCVCVSVSVCVCVRVSV